MHESVFHPRLVLLLLLGVGVSPLAPSGPFVETHAGDELPRCIGGLIFADLDGDSLFHVDDDDFLTVSVEIEILNEAGNVVARPQNNSTYPSHYEACGLIPFRNYRVRFGDIEGYTITKRWPLEHPHFTGSDPDPVTGLTPLFRLESSVDDGAWGVGYVPLVNSIGDRIWHDLDGNGIQDADEPPVAALTVELLDELGQVVDTTISRLDGAYHFVLLSPDTPYTLRVVDTFSLRPTSRHQGSDDQLDNDVDPVTRTSDPIVLTDDLDAERWDIGVRFGPWSIGDRTWIDSDADGIQDPTEPGLAGVGVDLFHESGQTVSTTSDADGNFEFGNIFAGDRFRLRFRPPVGYVFTTQDSGSDDNDSDASPETKHTDWFTVEGTVDSNRWDAGFASLLGTVGDRVWKDSDGDGTQDPREPGLPDVDILILRSTGQVVGVHSTDATGTYRFGNLITSTLYYLLFLAPDGYVFTASDVGRSDERDSDANPANGRTALFTPTTGATGTHWDAGFVHDCPFPNRPLRLTVAGGSSGSAEFDWFDPNAPERVTGYTVRRSQDVTVPISTWSSPAPAFDNPTFSDPEVPRTNKVFFYQFAAFNEVCAAEGPW